MKCVLPRSTPANGGILPSVAWSARPVGRLLRPVIVPFLASRLLIVISAAFLGPLLRDPRREDTLPLSSVGDLLKAIKAALYTGDAGWYAQIARGGYPAGPFNPFLDKRYAFFPGYPLVANVSGHLSPLDLDWTAIILSNAFFLLALVLLWQILAEEARPSAAWAGVWCLALFPESYYLSALRPESLFLAATMGAYLGARRGHGALAWVAGVAAGMTRPLGVTLPLVVLGEAIRRRPLSARNVAWSVVAASGAPIGLGLFAAFSLLQTGNAFASTDIERLVWGRHMVVPGLFPGLPLFHFLQRPYLVGYFGWDIGTINFLVDAVGIVAILWLFVVRRWELALYCLIGVLIPLSSLDTLMSSGRYVLGLFPVFMVLGLALDKMKADWRLAVFSISAALLGIQVVLSAGGIRAVAG